MDTKVISLIVAGIAVVFGLLISWKIAKAQLSAQVVSADRQDWKNGLRNIVAEFLGNSQSVVPAYRASTYSKDQAF